MIIYYGFYFLISGIAMICLFISSKYRMNTNKVLCISFVAALALLLALRSPKMGVDLQYGSPYGYLGRYIAIAYMSWIDAFTVPVLNYETGYIIFNKILSCFSKDPQFLLAICGLICSGTIGYMIYKKSKAPFLSFVIYLGLPCFLMNFSGLRQALAISITLFALPMIQKKKILLFVLIVLLASFFHSSAIVFLVAYPIYNIKKRKTFSIVSVLVIPLLYVLRYPLFSILSKLFKENAIPDNNASIVLFIVFFAIYIYAILLGNGQIKEENGYRNLFWIACCCQAFGGVYSTAIRVGYYFMIYLVFLLPEIVCGNSTEKVVNIDYTEKAFSYYVICLCFMAFGLYSLYSSSWAMTNPYHFFWQ